MPGTNFIDKATPIVSTWLNPIDRAVFDAIGDGSSAPSDHTTVKVNLGLDQVENTLDLNKPISIDTQAALDLKADISYVDTQDDLKSDLITTVTKDSSTGAAHVPVGTSGQRPGVPANGDIRYNTDTDSYEGYKEGNWLPLGGGATGGGTNDVFYENSITVTTDYTITTNKNAMSAGPITINSGVTVTVPNGSTWSIV